MKSNYLVKNKILLSCVKASFHALFILLISLQRQFLFITLLILLCCGLSDRPGL